jgi:formylmethanofuran dehydrogenase subunit E
MKPFTDLNAARNFHGHLGPNLIIGIKAGNYAKKVLNPESCFQLHAEVHCPGKPPISCIIDGVQLSTGCSMGKGNIAHVISDNTVKTIFTNTQTGQSLTLEIFGDFIEKTMRWFKELGEEECSKRTWEADDSEVFRACTN